MSKVEKEENDNNESRSEERKKGYERGLEMIEENPEAFEYLAER